MKLVAMILLVALVTAMSTNVLSESGWILWHDLKEVLHGDIGPSAYSAESGRRFRANPATPRSPATQGLSGLS